MKTNTAKIEVNENKNKIELKAIRNDSDNNQVKDAGSLHPEKKKSYYATTKRWREENKTYFKLLSQTNTFINYVYKALSKGKLRKLFEDDLIYPEMMREYFNGVKKEEITRKYVKKKNAIGILNYYIRKFDSAEEFENYIIKKNYKSVKFLFLAGLEELIPDKYVHLIDDVKKDIPGDIVERIRSLNNDKRSKIIKLLKESDR